MQAVAVGGLADEVVALWEGLGCAQYMAMQSPDVARIGNAFDLVVLLDREMDKGRAEHMPRVDELKTNLIINAISGVVVHRAEELHHLLRMVGVEERFDGGLVLAVHLLVVPTHILLLNESRVLQHEFA